MKETNDSRVYSKDGQRLRAFCIMRAVEGLSLEGAYSRLTTWEKEPSYKDLDWLFRPLGYTRTQIKKLVLLDDSKTFTKEKETISVNCVIDVVGVSRQAAFTRCIKWAEGSEDLDWLFRPKDVSKNKGKSLKFKKPRAVKKQVIEQTSLDRRDIQYEIALRKHMGLGVENYG